MLVLLVLLGSVVVFPLQPGPALPAPVVLSPLAVALQPVVLPAQSLLL